MFKKLILSVSALLMLAVVSSCGSLDPLTADNFTCNPSPLVEEGGQVNATITVTYPEKYFNKKATLTVTPVLEYATGSTKSTPVTFQGEKVNGNDQEVNYKYGGTATFRASFLYNDAMASSKLRLDFSADVSGKTITLPSVYIADGVIATESLASALSNTPAYAADQFVKDTFDKYIATMIYQYQSTNLRSSESGKQEVKDMQDVIVATKDEERRQFEGLDMVSTASPEGSYSLNERLAAGREKSSAAYLQKFLKKAKMDGQITPEQIAEDWEGFKALVEASSIQDKQLVLNVLGRISDPDQREQEIRNLSAAYKELADEILPQLRYSKVTATVRNIGHTNEEIMDLWKNDKAALTLEELLYAATLTNDAAQQEAIYKYAQQKFPNDLRAANDLAVLYYKQGKYSEAEGLWKNILSKDAANPQANMNMALVAMNASDWRAAETYLGKAGQCAEYGEAMGTLLTNKGQYAQAVASFGDVKSNNAAVANICAQNYSAAKSILDAVQNKDAQTYYLYAIIAARTNNAADVQANLKKAVSMDASLKAKAQNDLEFAKFASAVSAL